MSQTPNQSATRFVRNLVAAFCVRWKPADDTIRIYIEKLSKWKLHPDVWSRCLSKLIADCEGQELPPLKLIYGYLKSAEKTQLEPPGRHWYCFTWHERRFAMRIKDPSTVPVLSVDVEDPHLVVDNPYGYEAYSPREARAAFFEGYRQTSGDAARAEEMYAAATGQP